MLAVVGLGVVVAAPPRLTAAETAPLHAGAPDPACTPSILALSAGSSSNPDLSIFEAALERAGLTDMLEGDEQFTIFAPNDAAFETIPTNVLEAILADTELLTSILTYHFVPESLSSAALAQAGTATTLHGDELRFALDGVALTINGYEATVVCADVAAARSTVHVIDSLLMPTINDLIESGSSGAPTPTTPTTVESTTSTTVESTTSTTVESTTSTTVESTTSTTVVSPTPTTVVSPTPATVVSPTPAIVESTTSTTVVSPAFADPPSPASGHAEVVAQGLVRFSGGEHHWAVTTAMVTAAGSALGTTGPTFVLADGPGGVLVGPSGEPPAWRLAPGEAGFDDVSLDARSVAAVDGALILISPATGSGTNPFTPGEGLRDVDLVRDVLNTNEALLLESDVSVLVIVTEGAVTAGDTTIAAGSAVGLSGDITLINREPEPAVVVAAVIGPVVG